MQPGSADRCLKRDCFHCCLSLNIISEAYSTCKSLGHEWGAHVILRLHHNVSNSAAGVLQGSGGGGQLLVWERQRLQAQHSESESLLQQTR